VEKRGYERAKRGGGQDCTGETRKKKKKGELEIKAKGSANVMLQKERRYPVENKEDGNK